MSRLQNQRNRRWRSLFSPSDYSRGRRRVWSRAASTRLGDTRTPTIIGSVLDNLSFSFRSAALSMRLKMGALLGLSMATTIGAAAYFGVALVALEGKLKKRKYQRADGFGTFGGHTSTNDVGVRPDGHQPVAWRCCWAARSCQPAKAAIWCCSRGRGSWRRLCFARPRLSSRFPNGIGCALK